jgi:hypothetical protein
LKWNRRSKGRKAEPARLTAKPVGEKKKKFYEIFGNSLGKRNREKTVGTKILNSP